MDAPIWDETYWIKWYFFATILEEYFGMIFLMAIWQFFWYDFFNKYIFPWSETPQKDELHFIWQKIPKDFSTGGIAQRYLWWLRRKLGRAWAQGEDPWGEKVGAAGLMMMMMMRRLMLHCGLVCYWQDLVGTCLAFCLMKVVPPFQSKVDFSSGLQ